MFQTAINKIEIRLIKPPLQTNTMVTLQGELEEEHLRDM